MIRGNHIRKFLFLISSVCTLTVLAFPAAAQDNGPKTYETLYSTVNYNQDVEIYEFGRRIGTSEAALVRDNQKALVLMKENIDRIVYRVKTILDMYPVAFHFNIFIYPNYNDVREVYRSKGMTGAAPISFYSDKAKTVYLSLENVTDRILAHEIAHAVINAYFYIAPPAQVQEILAQYVDKHLWDGM